MSKSLIPVKFKNMLKKLGATLLPDTVTHRFRMDIPSESSDRIYRVSQSTSHKGFECSCPSWLFQKLPPSQRTPCKHIRAMSPVLQQLNKLLPLGKRREIK